MAANSISEFKISNPFSVSSEEVISRLRSSEDGLTDQEAQKRCKELGLNVLSEKKKDGPFLIFLRQFRSAIVLLLAAAAIVAYFFSGIVETIAILCVILINAVMGFIIEFSAVKAMDALKKLDVLKCKVYRDGNLKEINAIHLAVGDVVFIEAGDLIPADSRVIQLFDLEANESALTGESFPVKKIKDVLRSDTILADQKNMLFKGTAVVKGNCRAVVTGTGNNTEIGKIASLVESAEESATPLEVKLEKLTKRLIVITAVLAVFIFAVGMIQGENIYLVLETAIALAVAAIPEGLPIVATIALANGMHKMAKKNVIVKKLSSVETLGGINVLMTDKTGTLTENRIEVESVFSFGQESFNDLKGNLEKNEENIRAFRKHLLKVFALCNNAVFNENGNSVGDPLEVALLQFTSRYEDHQALIEKNERVHEIPFNSDTKLMATLHKSGSSFLVVAKGAVEELLKKCKHEFHLSGEIVSIDEKKWLELADQLATKGQRTLGFAFKNVSEDHPDFLNNLIFLSVCGFLDPPRKDILPSLNSCQEAGVRVVMITGDHPSTALAVAKSVGLVSKEETKVITGRELESTDGLQYDLRAVSVFARVTPKHKLDLVKLYQKDGFIAGMTGDGINDAPALKQADIGIAMGQRGTQVAAEAANMILKDDSFVSIVKAISLGRTIFENIRKFIIYLLSCNLSEIFLITSVSLFDITLPLYPMQILFLNLVTDVFPALALGMGEEDELAMKRPPRDPKTQIIERKDWTAVIVYAVVISFSIAGAFLFSHFILEDDPNTSNNISFFALAFAQLFHIFNMPSYKTSFIRNEVTRNIHIWLALIFCTILIMLTRNVGFLSDVLNIGNLSTQQWMLILISSLIPVVVIQILKRTQVIR